MTLKSFIEKHVENLLYEEVDIPGWAESDKSAVDSCYDFTTAGILMPPHAETTHALYCGAPGVGKSVALMEKMDQVRALGQRAIVFDPGFEFTQYFYRAGKDELLNPFDTKSTDWNIWGEVPSDRPELWTLYMATLFGKKAEGDNAWVIEGARTIAREACKRLREFGKATNANLHYLLTSTPNADLFEFLRGTPAMSLLSPKEDSKQVQAYRGEFAIPLEVLPHIQDTNPFSIRDWVLQDNDSCLFLPCSAEQHEILRPMISLWLEIAARAVLSLPPSRTRRVHFIIDEFPSLQKIMGIPKVMAEGRKFGAAVSLGLQLYPQAAENYGDNLARTILGTCKTWAVFQMPEPQTAKYLAEAIGEIEEDVRKESLTMSASDERDSAQISADKKPREVATRSDIMNLPRLTGYLKVPDGLPICKFKMTPRSREQLCSGFEPCSPAQRGAPKIDMPLFAPAASSEQNVPEESKAEQKARVAVDIAGLQLRSQPNEVPFGGI